MNSIITEHTKNCFLCGNPNVEEHHIFFGTANRNLSDRYGLVVPLCNKHHTGSAECPHKNRVIDLLLKYTGQMAFEKKHGDREDFRRTFGKSYL